MRWGDVQLQSSAEGTKFLEYTERKTKTRTGAEPKGTRTVKPKMLSVSGSDRDPLRAFHLYAAKRPEQMKEINSEESPFYLALILTKMAKVQSDANGRQQVEFTHEDHGSKSGFECSKPHQPQQTKANDPKVKRLITSPYSHHANIWS